MLRVAEQYSGSDTGRQRRANEDSLMVRSPLFVVADGMGGAQAGEVASKLAVEAFRDGLPDGGEPEAALAGLAQAANTRIHELSHANAEQAGMGTTLTAVYVGEREIAIAHVGDSRAYCLRDGVLLRLTDDHSLVDELMRQGRLTPEEAVEHPQRSVITRALGIEGTVEVDTRSFKGRAGDVYLVCSDGLTTMVSEERIAEILGATPGLRDAGERLIAEANRAGGRDNITVVLLRLEEVSGPALADGGADEPTLTGIPAVARDGRRRGRRPGRRRNRDRGAGGPAARRRAAAPAHAGGAGRAEAPAPAAAPGRSRGGRARRAGPRRRRRVPGDAVRVLHRHQQTRAGDALPRGAVHAPGQHQPLQQPLRLGRERRDAQRTSAQLAARPLAAIRRQGRFVDPQPRTRPARMSARQ